MVHPLIERLVRSEMATLAELGTVYNTRDAWSLDQILNIKEEVEYKSRVKNASN